MNFQITFDERTFAPPASAEHKGRLARLERNGSPLYVSGYIPEAQLRESWRADQHRFKAEHGFAVDGLLKRLDGIEQELTMRQRETVSRISKLRDFGDERAMPIVEKLDELLAAIREFRSAAERDRLPASAA